MPRCPRCRHHFRVLEDEEGMHDCPHCGLSPHEDDPPPDEDSDSLDEGLRELKETLKGEPVYDPWDGD